MGTLLFFSLIPSSYTLSPSKTFVYISPLRRIVRKIASQYILLPHRTPIRTRIRRQGSKILCRILFRTRSVWFTTPCMPSCGQMIRLTGKLFRQLSEDGDALFQHVQQEERQLSHLQQPHGDDRPCSAVVASSFIRVCLD